MTSNGWKIERTTRALLLVRVSTEKQAGKRTRRGREIARGEKVSDKLQEEKCRALARELIPGISDAEMQVRPDLGVSGLKEDRLEEIVRAAEASPRPAAPGYVLALNVSRFCRLNAPKAFGYIDRLERAGWRLAFDWPRPTGNPLLDNTVLAMLMEMSAEYSRQLKENVTPAMRSYAQNGEVQGGRPVAGFTIGPDGHYVALPARDPAVKTMKRAFQRIDEGWTIVRAAKEAGCLPTTLRHRLENPVYVGDVEWGRRVGSKAHGIKVNAHVGIIDRALFERVQARLKMNGPRAQHIEGALPYILSGMIPCPKCGKPLYGGGGVAAKATPADRLRDAAYRCKMCPGTRVNQAALEATVFSVVAKFLADDDKSGNLQKRVDQWLADQLQTESGTAVTRQRAKLEEAKARLLKLAETTDDKDGSIARRMVELDRQLAHLTGARPNAAALKARAKQIIEETRAVIRAAGAVSLTDEEERAEFEQIRKGIVRPRPPVTLTPQQINANLARLRPAIYGLRYDPEYRLVEVDFATSPRETGTALVPHSKSNARSPGGSLTASRRPAGWCTTT